MAQVYMIINKLNNKKYVGITKHTFKKRYSSKYWHESNAMNRILKRSINKNGSDNFEVVILENTTINLLEERERFYIEKENSFFPNGYNLTKGGEYNKEVSENTKKLLSKKLKGKKAWNKGLKIGKMNQEHANNSAKAHKKPIVCYNKNFEIVKIYEGAVDVKKDGFNPSAVCRICKGYLNSHKNHYFKYLSV